MTDITVPMLQDAVTKSLRSSVDQVLVDEINSLTDPIMQECYADNLICFGSVLEEGKYSLPQYLNAVRYVSYKLMGDNNEKAHRKTFPEKHVDWKARGIKKKRISNYIYAYNGGKMVMAMLRQAVIPTTILNAGKFQSALNVLCDIASDDKVLPKDRVAAADSLVRHLKPLEVATVAADAVVHSDDTIEQLAKIMHDMAKLSVDTIKSGQTTAHAVAAAPMTITQGTSNE